MFTSDTEKTRSSYANTALHYVLIACFCALFGAVYERFGHEVYSYCMLYAFAFPLAGGALPFLLLHRYRKPRLKQAFLSMYHAGIMTLTVGSLLTGALEIYGTTNPLTVVYWIVGGVLVSIASIGALFGSKGTAQVVTPHQVR